MKKNLIKQLLPLFGNPIAKKFRLERENEAFNLKIAKFKKQIKSNASFTYILKFYNKALSLYINQLWNRDIINAILRKKPHKYINRK